jgi:DNA-binding LytR/AlgR family response regulator
LLAAHADFEIVGECRNGREAIKAIREQPLDLVFLDVQMPKLNGFEVITAISAEAMPAGKFLRIRRSIIVNAERIREMQPPFKGEYLIVLQDGTELTSSRRYRTQLNPLLGASG